MQISDHFTSDEMTKTSTGIENKPCPSEFANLVELCHEILEPVRALLNQTLIITSGYRSQQVNRAVKGKPTSQHLDGCAADFVPKDGDCKSAYLKIVDSRLKYDQLIWEKGWIHISWSKKPRGEHWIA